MLKITRRHFIQLCAVSGLLDTKHLFRNYQSVQPVQVPLPQKSTLEDTLLYRIVDRSHPISEDEIKKDIEPNLVKLKLSMDGILVAHENVIIHRLCLPALESLFEASNAARTGLYIHSGFRSYEQQSIAYSQAKDKSTVLLAGTSQHHTGLAIDFTSSEIGKVVDIHSGFDQTKAGQWIKQNGPEFGFVQSYLTNHDQIQNESWHFLYLGKPLAQTFTTLKAAGWYGDVFLLQLAMQLRMTHLEFLPEA